MQIYETKIIAHIRNDFKTKFGIPRQSGLVNDITSAIVFEPEYRDASAFRDIEQFSHLWIIWQFSEAVRDDWSPTVRPPRLGGNKRVGVFATRSPFRPNAIGLSSVKLEGVELTDAGPVLYVSGADLMDGTPIFDIKPYLPFTDCHTDAVGGFADEKYDYALKVEIEPALLNTIPDDKREGLLGILAQDPRPSYQDDESRVYGFEYAQYEVKFTVSDGTLTVIDIK